MTRLTQAPEHTHLLTATTSGPLPIAAAPAASQAKPGKSRWPARLDLLQSLSGLLLALFLMAHMAFVSSILISHDAFYTVARFFEGAYFLGKPYPILVSGVVSLTLTPMLCSRYLSHTRPDEHGRIFRLFERFFAAWLNIYDITLRAAMAHPRTVLVAFIATIVFSASLFSSIPKGFLPSGDSGQITASTEGAQDTSFAAMVERQRAVAAIIAQDPNVRSFMSSVGGGGPRSTANTGSLNLILKPRNERALSADEIIQELRPKLAAVPGIRVYMQNPPAIRIGGQQTSSLYQYTLQSTDLTELYQWTEVLLGKIRQIPGLIDVNSNLKNQSPVVALDVDRDKIAETFTQIPNRYNYIIHAASIL